GTVGLCDHFLYLMGQDEWLSGGPSGLKDGTLATSYDGVLIVRVKMAWDFTSTTKIDDQRSFLSSAEAVIRPFNFDRRLTIRALFGGKSLRLRVFFAARYVSRTFPSDSNAATYLKSLSPPQTAATYPQRVTQSINAAN